MKRILALVLALCLAASLCACGKGNTIEGKGYKTPEEALLAYAEALKTGDMDKILSTFAVETHVKNFDMKVYLDYAGTYSKGLEYILNPTDTFSQEAGVIQRQFFVTRQVSYMCGYVALGEVWEKPITISENGDYKSASKFLNKMDQDWVELLSEMEIDDIVEPEDLVGEDVWENAEDRSLKTRAKYLGCDEIMPLALEIELDGEDYYLCMDVVCYDGKWYNCIQSGFLGTLMGASAYTGGLVER